MVEPRAPSTGGSSSSHRWSGWFFGVLNVAAGGSPDDPSTVYTVLNTIWSLGTLIPGLSIAVRRLHDTHRSGWWLLLFIFPVIGWIWLLVYFI